MTCRLTWKLMFRYILTLITLLLQNLVLTPVPFTSALEPIAYHLYHLLRHTR